MEAEANADAHSDGRCPLLELPTEMILRICDFLDSETVIKVLGRVCQFFALLAADDLIWKTRIHKRWPGKRYPPIHATGTFDWKTACIERENEYRKWSDVSQHMTRTDIQFGFCVDVVHMTANENLVLGLRDHTLYSFKMSDIPMATQPDEGGDTAACVANVAGLESFQASAHKGWIWTVSSSDDVLCSGSWDSKVMLWNYSGEQISTYICDSAVLCSTMADTEILAGTFNKTIVKIDTRQPSPVSKTQVYARPILCLQQTPNWIIAGSESKIIHIIDRKTMKVCSTARLPSGYPRSMSLNGDVMYIGSKSGQVHMYSFDEPLGLLKLVETFEGGHNAEVRSIRPTLGSVLTAAKDGVCRIWEPSSSPSVIQSLSCPVSEEICSMDYRKGNLVFGTGSGLVTLYRNKT